MQPTQPETLKDLVLIPLSPSTSVALFSAQIEIFTPFNNHIDPSRSNMVSKQLTQQIIGTQNDTPFIIDKNYREITEVESPWVEYATSDGYLLLSEDNVQIIYYPESKKLEHKYVPWHKKLINNSLSLKYIAPAGKIKKGEVLFDYTGMLIENHLPKIGYRTRIMFSSWYGFSTDDSFVISESYARKTDIEYSQKIFIPISKEWKFLKNKTGNFLPKVGDTLDTESIARYYKIDSSDHFMAERNNLDNNDSLFYTKNIECILGATVDNIKVHKNTMNSFLENNEKYIYTDGLIQEVEAMDLISRDRLSKMKNTLRALSLPEDTVNELSEEMFASYFGTDTFSKAFEKKLLEEFKLDADNVDYLLEIDTSFIKRTTRGDKFANLFAGKGVIGQIIPDDLMPIDPDTGLAIELIVNPLSIFGRNNWGSIFELAISKIIDDIEFIINNQEHLIQKEMITVRLQRLNDLFISKYDKEYSEEINKIISNFSNDEFYESFIEDIKKNNFYIFVPNFTMITYSSFYDDFISPYCDEFNIRTKKSKFVIKPECIQWLREQGYKNSVFQDELYSPEIEAFTGSNYMLKLYHTSHSKYNSVSFAKSYSMITGMPKKGRKSGGGQHLSWQSLAGILAHKENNGILKELYTIKSDTSSNIKESFLMKFVSTGEYSLNHKYTSLTKQTINNGLKLIGMRFKEENK